MSAPLIVKTPKPRNPFVALARFRHAGAHRSRKTSHESQRAYRREVERLHLTP